MVSGFVTSPCDHDMIVSGDASESFSASKFSSFSNLFPLLPYLYLWTTRPTLAKSAISRGLRPFEIPDSASFGGILPELFALETDAEVKRYLGDVLFRQDNLAFVLAQDLDPEREALQLLDQHTERFRNAGLERVVALDDRLVGLDAADDVVRLHGQDLLQNMRGAVSLERPHLHLSEPLPAELRLAAERLLGDEAVRPGRPGVDLVLHQVRELEHVDHPDGHRLVELLAGPAVAQANLAVHGQPRLLQLFDDRFHRRAVEHGSCDLLADGGRDPAEVRLQHLAEVHTARHAERVEHDVDRCAVRKVRHVLGGHDPGDHALVAVAAGHLVPG